MTSAPFASSCLIRDSLTSPAFATFEPPLFTHFFLTRARNRNCRPCCPFSPALAAFQIFRPGVSFTTAHHPTLLYVRGVSHNGSHRIQLINCFSSMPATVPRGLSACGARLWPVQTSPLPCRFDTHGAAPAELVPSNAAMPLKYRTHEDHPAQSVAESRSSAAPVCKCDNVWTLHV